jgi:hypothetical protein
MHIYEKILIFQLKDSMVGMLHLLKSNFDKVIQLFILFCLHLIGSIFNVFGNPLGSLWTTLSFHLTCSMFKMFEININLLQEILVFSIWQISQRSQNLPKFQTWATNYFEQVDFHMSNLSMSSFFTNMEVDQLIGQFVQLSIRVKTNYDDPFYVITLYYFLGWCVFKFKPCPN